MKSYQRIIVYGLMAFGSFYANSLSQDKNIISGVVKAKPIYKAPSFLYPGEMCTFTLETKDKLRIIKGSSNGEEICSSIKEGDTLVVKLNNLRSWDKDATYISLDDIVSINGKKFK